MGFGGGGKGKTTVTQNNEPPKWAEPLFRQSAGVAQDLYSSGVGFNPYPGSTVAEPSRNTMLGMQGMTNVALDPASYHLASNPANLTNQVLDQGGLMNPAIKALGFFGDAAGGGQDITTGQDYRDIYSRAQQPGAIESYLAPTASGEYLAEGNPYFREILNKEADRLDDRIAGQFSGAGRYGSGAHQGVTGEEVGNFMLRGLAEDFNRERGLQVDAAKSLEAAQQGRLGLQGDAVSGLSGVMGQNVATRMGAAAQGADISNQGLVNALNYIGALPTIQQNRLFAPQLLQQMGAQQDQSNQAQINDMVRRYYEQDMAPWTRLGALQAAAQGSAGQYGTMHRVSQQPSTFNPLQFGGSLLSMIAGVPMV